MKKSARQNATTNALRERANLTTVQAYHAGASYGEAREAYAFRGFKVNKYFTSDRFTVLQTLQDGTAGRPDGKPLKGIGLEIETECGKILDDSVLAEIYNKIIFAHFPEDLFKLQSDGSLGGRSSAECITQIMTKEFIRNHYREFKMMFDHYFPAFGISADSAHTHCGMHVNVSAALFGGSPEKIEDNVKKLLYVINRHFSFFAALFYRVGDTTYCGRMPAYADKEAAKSADLHRFSNDHFICLNLSHFDAGRVEIRLVGGQKNFACFRNTLEAVFHLIDALHKTPWEKLDDLYSLFKGCNQYVFDRIATYCRNAGTIDAATVERIGATVKRADYI